MFKINGNYPYPVLLEEEKYFKSSTIHAEYYKSATEDEHIIRIDCLLDNEQILKMIEEGKAEYIVQIESPNAFYRKVFCFSNSDNIEIRISKDEIIDYIDMGLAIIAREDIYNYENDDFIDEYKGINFDIKKNEMLAIANPRKNIEIFYDGEILKEVKNLFLFKRSDTNMVSYNNDGDRIVVYIPQDLLNKYAEYKNYGNKSAITILNSLVFVPVLTGIINDMILIDDISKYKTWYKTLKFKIESIAKEEKRDADACINEPLETAQKLLSYPFINITETMDLIMEVND